MRPSGVDQVGVRVQQMPESDQVLVLSRIVEGRLPEPLFAPRHLDSLFDEIGLPRPKKTWNVLDTLKRDKLVTQAKVSGKVPSWRLTPLGRLRSSELASDMDLAVLAAEAVARTVTMLGDTPHPVVPPSLAPPDLIGPLRAFFDDYPFERNVFGMTRFPSEGEPDDDPDHVAVALECARDVCASRGLQFHLASDRQIVDGLWANVAAHIWACQYGIAFFENRVGRGLNYNLTIEVGSCLVLGRRLAILRDATVGETEEDPKLPSDLVGQIYKPVDLSEPHTVEEALRLWIQDDLRVGAAATPSN